MNNMNSIPLWALFLLGAILVTQGTWLFLHARKHGYYPWLWALWGFLSFPLPSLVYVLFVAQPWRRTIPKNRHTDDSE